MRTEARLQRPSSHSCCEFWSVTFQMEEASPDLGILRLALPIKAVVAWIQASTSRCHLEECSDDLARFVRLCPASICQEPCH